MTVFKCKMCGGTLEVKDGVSVAECEYCGTTQTLPTSNDEVLVNLFNRANNLRIKCEFDKAVEVYEKILDVDNTQAEAHWGIVLCKYGVEYVEDPHTNERIPTCHRTQMESILTDADYQSTVKYADTVASSVYETQAKEINELQKKILQIVKSEKPFDVFICYKETDDAGTKTRDSVIANEIYHELTNSGLKVFFAAITLEDKLGEEYEPYIYAALTSAKVMLVLGTKPEYFSAVWVKNEWSRYLHLMKTDREKKRTLVPCFRDMDAYDLPDDFSHLQALDMASIAFMPDLMRNIKKLVGKEQKEPDIKIKSDNNIQLLEYLGRVKYLEYSCWCFDTIIGDLNNKYKSLGQKPNIERPKEPSLDVAGKGIVTGAIIGVIGGWALSLPVLIIGLFFPTIKNMADGILDVIGLWYFVICAFVGAILALLIEISSVSATNQDKKKEYSDMIKQYDIQIEELNKRYDYECNYLIPECQKILNQLSKEYKEVDDIRKKYYRLNIIYPKYRNISAVSMLYQYIASGRCSQLDGPNGAINIYESELQNNTIMPHKSGYSSQEIEMMKTNQGELHTTLSNIVRTVNTIMNEVDKCFSNRNQDISGVLLEINIQTAIMTTRYKDHTEYLEQFSKNI